MDARPKHLAPHRRWPRPRFATSTLAAMDHRPAGPRQPPDKRNAAYESIFGRPGGMHHPSTLPAHPKLGQYQNSHVVTDSTSQQFPQRHPYQQQHYPPQPDRPPSFTDYGHPALHASYPSQPQGLHRTPTQPNQPPYSYQNAQYTYQNNQQASLSPPQTIGRARSMNSVPYSSQPVHQVQEPDPPQERYTRAGLTPAQAYQQQVYMTGGHQSHASPNRHSHHSPHNSISGTSTHSQNGTLPDTPKVNLDLGTDGNLGLNFSVDATSPLTAASSSELPWASTEPSGMLINVIFGDRGGESMFQQIQWHNCHPQVAYIPKPPPTTTTQCMGLPVPILSNLTRL